MDEPFQISCEESCSNIVLTAEHASPDLPEGIKNLGIPDHFLPEIPDYYDIGVGEIINSLSKRLNATALWARYTRLLIDLNRGLAHPQLIREKENHLGITIPMNLSLTQEAKMERIKRFWKPYHRKLSEIIERKLQTHKKIYVFPLHSCFPVFRREKRDFDVDLLFKNDQSIAERMQARLTQERIDTKLNYHPFNGKTQAYVMNQFEEPRIKWVFIEINNRILGNKHQIRRMATILGEAIKAESEL